MIQHPEYAGQAARIITAIPRVTIENKDQLKTAEEWLRFGSIVVYLGPHTCMYDSPIVTQRILRPYLRPAGPKRFAWLTSSKFFEEVDEAPRMGTAGAASEEYAKLMGFQMLPIFQVYRLGELTGAQRVEAQNNNFSSFRTAQRILKVPGGIVGVSSEGTRGTTGGLQRGHESIRVLLKVKNTIALPIILSGVWQMQEKDKEGLDGLHPFVYIQACIGEPINYQEAEKIASQYGWKNEEMGEFTIDDALMIHAAAHGLSEIKPGVDPRGVYAWENIISRLPTFGV